MKARNVSLVPLLAALLFLSCGGAMTPPYDIRGPAPPADTQPPASRQTPPT